MKKINFSYILIVIIGLSVFSEQASANRLKKAWNALLGISDEVVENSPKVGRQILDDVEIDETGRRLKVPVREYADLIANETRGVFLDHTRKVRNHHFAVTNKRKVQTDAVFKKITDPNKKVTVLTGQRGSGKSHVIADVTEQLAKGTRGGRYAGAIVIEINMKNTRVRNIEEVGTMLRELRSQVAQEYGEGKPVVFYIDDVKKFLMDNSDKAHDARISFDDFIDEIYRSGNSVYHTRIIVETNSASYDELVKIAGYISANSTVHVPPLSITELRVVYRHAADIIQEEVKKDTKKSVIISDDVIEHAERLHTLYQYDGGVVQLLRDAAYSRNTSVGGPMQATIQNLKGELDKVNAQLEKARRSRGAQARVVEVELGGGENVGRKHILESKIRELEERAYITVGSGESQRRIRVTDRIEELRRHQANGTLTDAHREEYRQLRQRQTSLTLDDLAREVSEARGIDIAELTVVGTDVLTYKDVISEMKRLIFGQDEAVEKLVRAMELAKRVAKSRPKAFFMFTGNPGLGKTHTILTYATLRKKRIIRLDCSEMDGIEKAREMMVGAPAGYVGFDNGTSLAEQVFNNPDVVVLLDEVEKAHPKVQEYVLSIAEGARLRASNGDVADFRKAAVFMTTNVTSKPMRTYHAMKQVLPDLVTSKMDDLAEAGDIKQLRIEIDATLMHVDLDGYKPLLLALGMNDAYVSRLMEIVHFKDLGSEEMIKILNIQLSEYNKELSEQIMRVSMTDEAKSHFAKQALNVERSGRSIVNNWERILEPELTSVTLYGNTFNDASGAAVRMREGDIIEIFLKDGDLSYRIVPEEEAGRFLDQAAEAAAKAAREAGVI